MTLASQKVGSLDSRPVPLRLIQVDNHENQSMWSSLKIFLRDARLSKGSVDSRPVPLASIEVESTKKSNKYVIVPQKFFSVTLASQKVGLDSRPGPTRLYWSW